MDMRLCCCLAVRTNAKSPPPSFLLLLLAARSCFFINLLAKKRFESFRILSTKTLASKRLPSLFICS